MWYNPAWFYRKQITVDYTKVVAALTGFPVLISLDSDAQLASYAQADGDDILFTDSNNAKLSHEIEKFVSGTGELVAWVKAPALSNTADTVLYMYFGNPAAASQQDAVNVWDANYIGVWHKKDATTTTIADSTANGLTGNKRAVGEPAETAGQIAFAQSYDGLDDYIQVPSNDVMDAPSELTAEAWLYDRNDGTQGHSFNRDTHGVRIWIIRRDTDTTVNWHIFNSSGDLKMFCPAGSWAINTWFHIACTAKVVAPNIVMEVFFNGVSRGTAAFTGAAIQTGVCAMQMGADNTEGSSLKKQLMDEARFSNIVRSAEWLLTEYNNQSSPGTFYGMADMTRRLPQQPPFEPHGVLTNLQVGSVPFRGDVL